MKKPHRGVAEARLTRAWLESQPELFPTLEARACAKSFGMLQYGRDFIRVSMAQWRGGKLHVQLTFRRKDGESNPAS